MVCQPHRCTVIIVSFLVVLINSQYPPQSPQQQQQQLQRFGQQQRYPPLAQQQYGAGQSSGQQYQQQQQQGRYQFQSRYGQSNGSPYGPQFNQQQRNLQQNAYQQNADNNKRRSYPSGFVNTPLVTSNTSNGALMQLRLVSYTNPMLSLPHGKTCVCPEGKSCPFLQPGIPSCMFSFTIIVSAPDQSVQYMSSEFMPVMGPTISSGNWTALHTLNLTGRPMAIDVFVHHLGVVIDQSDAQLEFYNFVILVDTFVVSLADYDASQGAGVSTTATGRLQGTTLQLEYSVQCTDDRQGPNCDLSCTPSTSDPNSASCVSLTTGLVSSCKYSGTQVIDCQQCQNGISEDGTTCIQQVIVPDTSAGVSPAFRVWTIVLGCLLGVSILFVILLIIFYVISRNRQKEAENNRLQQPYTPAVYLSPPSEPLIRKDDEWNREGTRATNNLRTTTTDHETSSDESFSRGNGTTASKREAQV